MDVALDAYRCRWIKDGWMGLFEVAWLVGLLIIKSCIDLICSLLMFKQLIISNPMTHLLLKWNVLKRGLFCSCIIGFAIYALRCQLTDFVYLQSSHLSSQMCSYCYSLNVCMINSNLNSEKLFVKASLKSGIFVIHFIIFYLKYYLCWGVFFMLKSQQNEFYQSSM